MFFYMLPQIGVDLPRDRRRNPCIRHVLGGLHRRNPARRPPDHSGGPNRSGARPWHLATLALAADLVPQALRLGMPSLINELILLVKVSSLASVVGIGELTRVAQNIAGQSYRHLEIYLAAAAVYLAINLVIASLGRTAERRLALV